MKWYSSCPQHLCQGVVQVPAYYWINMTLITPPAEMHCTPLVWSRGCSGTWTEDLVWNLLFAALSFTHFVISELLRVRDSSHICLVPIDMGKLRRFPFEWNSPSLQRPPCMCTFPHPVMQWKWLRLAVPVEGLHPCPLSACLYSCRWLIAEDEPIGLILPSGLCSRSPVLYLPSCWLEMVTWVPS